MPDRIRDGPADAASAGAAGPLAIDIWSDVICPWCQIGLTRLERVLASIEGGRDAVLRHHSYRLMPGVAPQKVGDYIARRTGRQPAAMFAHVEGVAAAEGLIFRLDEGVVGDTLDAHRLAKLGAANGRGREVLGALYSAYLTERRSVLDRDSLLALAVEAGLDRAETTRLLAGHRFAAEVEDDEQRLRLMGGNGVPLFLVNGRSAISGAQPAEVFAEVLRREGAASARPVPHVGSCGADGCLG